MGKSLIIKGANFEQNCISTQLVIDCTSAIQVSNVISSFASWAPFADVRYSQLQGKIIRQVEFKAARAGTISILKAQSLNSGGTELIGTITISENDVDQIKKYPLNIEVGLTDIICIGAESDTGAFYYSKEAGEGLLVRVGTENQSIFNSWSLSINWYCE